MSGKNLVTQSLRELTQQFKEVQELVYSGECTNEMMQDTLDGIDLSFDKKVEQVAEVRNNLSPSIEGTKAEIKRLEKRLKALQVKESWLTDYLRDQMSAMNKTKIVGEFITVTIVKGRELLDVVDEDQIDDKYFDGSYVTKLDKSKLLADLKAEKDLPEEENGTIKGAKLKLSKSAVRTS